MRPVFSRALVTLGLALLFVPAAAQIGTTRPGDPLPGITPREFEEFRLGLDTFTGVETVDDGLGPAFNGTSCGACHAFRRSAESIR